MKTKSTVQVDSNHWNTMSNSGTGGGSNFPMVKITNNDGELYYDKSVNSYLLITDKKVFSDVSAVESPSRVYNWDDTPSSRVNIDDYATDDNFKETIKEIKNVAKNSLIGTNIRPHRPIFGVDTNDYTIALKIRNKIFEEYEKKYMNYVKVPNDTLKFIGYIISVDVDRILEDYVKPQFKPIGS